MARPRSLLLTALCWLLSPIPHAFAQDNSRPRFEVGAQGGALLAIGGSEAFFGTLGGPRVSVGVTSRFSIELTADDFLGPDGDGLYGFYALSTTYAVPRRANQRTTLLVTVGGAGTFYLNRHREYRFERPDGSVFIQHARWTGEISRPMAALIGAGFHHVVSPRIAIRSDVQAMVFGEGVIFRATSGVSIPIGARYERAR